MRYGLDLFVVHGSVLDPEPLRSARARALAPDCLVAAAVERLLRRVVDLAVDTFGGAAEHDHPRVHQVDYAIMAAAVAMAIEAYTAYRS